MYESRFSEYQESHCYIEMNQKGKLNTSFHFRTVEHIKLTALL